MDNPNRKQARPALKTLLKAHLAVTKQLLERDGLDPMLKSAIDTGHAEFMSAIEEMKRIKAGVNNVVEQANGEPRPKNIETRAELPPIMHQIADLIRDTKKLILKKDLDEKTRKILDTIGDMLYGEIIVYMTKKMTHATESLNNIKTEVSITEQADKSFLINCSVNDSDGSSAVGEVEKINNLLIELSEEQIDEQAEQSPTSVLMKKYLLALGEIIEKNELSSETKALLSDYYSELLIKNEQSK